MRDEEYIETMLEAYRDVLSKILEGRKISVLHDYIIEQIKFYVEWSKE